MMGHSSHIKFIGPRAHAAPLLYTLSPAPAKIIHDVIKWLHYCALFACWTHTRINYLWAEVERARLVLLSQHMEKFAAWENLHRHSAELMDAKLVKGVSPALARLYRCWCAAIFYSGNFKWKRKWLLPRWGGPTCPTQYRLLSLHQINSTGQRQRCTRRPYILTLTPTLHTRNT